MVSSEGQEGHTGFIELLPVRAIPLPIDCQLGVDLERWMGFKHCGQVGFGLENLSPAGCHLSELLPPPPGPPLSPQRGAGPPPSMWRRPWGCCAPWSCSSPSTPWRSPPCRVWAAGATQHCWVLCIQCADCWTRSNVAWELARTGSVASVCPPPRLAQMTDARHGTWRSNTGTRPSWTS